MGQAKLTLNDHTGEWPDTLRRAAGGAASDETSDRPIVIAMDEPDSELRLDELLQTHPPFRVVDNYDEQYAELIVSHQPQLYRASLEVKRESLKEYLVKHYDGRPSWRVGAWVYYPWSGELVHVLERELFFESRTIRNKNLMTNEEQRQYADFSVACAGMSVGSNVALALALTGGSQQLKIADSAVLSATNLNRVAAGVSDVGSDKSLVVARRLLEMNPYLEIERFADITKENVSHFFEKPWPIRVVIDEIDDLKMKIELRVEARKRHIPVVMATDLGDDVMLDVERFDLNANLPLFHGLAGNIETLLDREVGKQEWLKHAMAIIGPKNVPLRLQQSLLKVGTQLVTQPQLGSTALVSGVVAAYAVRRLATGGAMKKGRSFVSLDAPLNPDVSSFAYGRTFRRHTKQLQHALDAM